jgi:hypothetical protein
MAVDRVRGHRRSVRRCLKHSVAPFMGDELPMHRDGRRTNALLDLSNWIW